MVLGCAALALLARLAALAKIVRASVNGAIRASVNGAQGPSLATVDTMSFRPWPCLRKKRSTLVLELPPPVRARLEELRAMVGADSTVEIVRRALSVYDVLITATRRDGARVILRFPDGTEQDVTIP